MSVTINKGIMKKYPGTYKALVESNTDPKNMDRVQIRVLGLMDGIPKSNLPWALKESGIFVEAKNGSSIVPPKGSKVTVYFQDEDINYPIYRGGVVESKSELPDQAQKGRYVIFSKGKLVLAFNENTGKLEIKTDKYNTDLDTILDTILSHVHLATVQGANTTPVTTALPPGTILPTVFNQGKL